MADFLIADALTGRTEGGFQMYEDDNGNWTGGKKGVGKLIGTNHGISAPVLKAYMGKEPAMGDMKNLSKETAREIYRKNYWNPIKGDQIVSQPLANQIYDMAVNAGVKTAIRLAQTTLNINPSGEMDSITLAALNDSEKSNNFYA